MKNILLCMFMAMCPIVGANAQWSESELSEALAYYRQLDSAALVVRHKGETVISWGEVNEKYNVASVRKSLLNSLYGIGYDRGWIELDSTLAELDLAADAA